MYNLSCTFPLGKISEGAACNEFVYYKIAFVSIIILLSINSIRPEFQMLLIFLILNSDVEHILT